MASPPSMSHPETIYPAPASYERAQAALAALDTARESLRSSEYSEADQRTALCWLANELGTTRPERGTLAAIRAVLEKLDRPDVFRRDQVHLPSREPLLLTALGLSYPLGCL